ncbi:MAG: class I SAM-dependent methyltransferase [Nitrospirota bacterium]|nr:class I SAM-dependent methyltransferase [Nitrospirota bacterium]MDH5585519.1 class I SAM-dependent methyltransferase [Nitrospirota bacterium]MDH5773618.1 class I SAM-dependent methyltransferase [Nitrospirota bacterium]
MPTPSPSSSKTPPAWLCEFPKKDPWSRPFAESLLTHLDLQEGLTILDVNCGDGIPAFYLAHRVGSAGQVLAIDVSEGQLIRARAVQGPYFPWLEFRREDVKQLSEHLGRFDRITGNLSFMFFRPDREMALHQLLSFLKPGGQLVLTFPSLGTFDSLWQRVDQEMLARGLTAERGNFAEYVAERPSAKDARRWLKSGGLERIEVTEYPLEVKTGAGNEFLYHPLLRGGFLDDVYECFAEQHLAESFMQRIAADTTSFVPLIAQRCVMSGWAL